jgi:hypothetical protein
VEFYGIPFCKSDKQRFLYLEITSAIREGTGLIKLAKGKIPKIRYFSLRSVLQDVIASNVKKANRVAISGRLYNGVLKIPRMLRGSLLSQYDFQKTKPEQKQIDLLAYLANEAWQKFGGVPPGASPFNVGWGSFWDAVSSRDDRLLMHKDEFVSKMRDIASYYYFLKNWENIQDSNFKANAIQGLNTLKIRIAGCQRVANKSLLEMLIQEAFEALVKKYMRRKIVKKCYCDKLFLASEDGRKKHCSKQCLKNASQYDIRHKAKTETQGEVKNNGAQNRQMTIMLDEKDAIKRGVALDELKVLRSFRLKS